MPKIAQIFRYPVKGLNAESVTRVELSPARAIPGDRVYAIAHGSTEFNSRDPQFLSKRKFLQLAVNERLASLQTRFDHETADLKIERKGKQVARGRLDQPVGRKMIEQFLAAFLSEQVRGSPRIVHAPNHTFSDVPTPCLSLINISSIRELERIMGVSIDPLRFRGNVYFDTGEPWSEFAWSGHSLSLGDGDEGVELSVIEPITRCAATNVNPLDGKRDLNIPMALHRAFAHENMGVYAKVTTGGTIKVGDDLNLI
jgi:uncharacterized protein YcbX